jgi:cell division protein FtsZ
VAEKSVETVASRDPVSRPATEVAQTTVTAPTSAFHSPSTGEAIPKAPSPLSAPLQGGRQETSVSVDSEPVPVQGTVASSPDGGAMQAHIYNDAFIPPKPVHVTENSPYETVSQVKPVQQAAPEAQEEAVDLTAQRSAPEAPAITASRGSNLELKPPVPGVNVVKKRKSASLFERFTTGILHSDRNEDESSETEGSAGDSTGGLAVSRPLTKTEQGSLAIDTPQQAQQQATSSEDELDIPAFLRRQAN